ncbi:MAG: taurine dioxygenase [Gammaproteobacteria bacterium]|nr:MAG: taurine dioxygenase [Gammaproteobacteria bacterium]
MSGRSFELLPLSGALGAEIRGLDLAQALDDETFAELHACWLEHMVLFFRDQRLTPEQHLTFGKRFGEIDPSAYIPSVPGHEEIRLQDMNDYSQIGNDINWHCDNSFREHPQKCSALYAIEVPRKGGDTAWANMCLAYELLSAPMRAFLDRLTAIHDLVETMGPGVLKQYGPERWQAFRDRTPPVEHPVVRTHPETGRKSLFVNPLMTSRIKELTEAESRELLDYLYRHATQEELLCRFRWEAGSLAFWDNRCTIHRGIADFYTERRIMHRVAITDPDRPH